MRRGTRDSSRRYKTNINREAVPLLLNDNNQLSGGGAMRRGAEAEPLLSEPGIALYGDQRTTGNKNIDNLFGEAFEDEYNAPKKQMRIPSFRNVVARQSPAHSQQAKQQYRPISTASSAMNTDDLLLFFSSDNNNPNNNSRRGRLSQVATMSRSRSVRHHDTHVMRVENPVTYQIGLCSEGLCCCQCIRTQQVGVQETFGKYDDLLKPGFHCIPWPFTCISRLSLRVQQLDVLCETKTRDNVFVHIQISVQYRVVVGMAYYAYYRLSDPRSQIKSHVFDVVRSKVPTMDLDDVFESKTTLAQQIRHELRRVMNDYGYEVVHSLVTDLRPNETVKICMNEVEASRRIKHAMSHKAEAKRVQIVKQAEADAQHKYLLGVGLAKERRAIAEGLEKAAKSWNEKNTKANDNDNEISGKFNLDDELPFRDVVDLLLITQYMDILTHVGGNNLFLRNEPGEVFAVQDSLPKSHKIPDLLQ